MTCLSIHLNSSICWKYSLKLYWKCENWGRVQDLDLPPLSSCKDLGVCSAKEEFRLLYPSKQRQISCLRAVPTLVSCLIPCTSLVTRSPWTCPHRGVKHANMYVHKYGQSPGSQWAYLRLLRYGFLDYVILLERRSERENKTAVKLVSTLFQKGT